MKKFGHLDPKSAATGQVLLHCSDEEFNKRIEKITEDCELVKFLDTLDLKAEFGAEVDSMEVSTNESENRENIPPSSSEFSSFLTSEEVSV